MYQEKRYLVLDDEVVQELDVNQKLLTDGLEAVVFDWDEQELYFYNPDGERKVVKLPQNKVWSKVEIAYRILRVNADEVWLAYLMDGRFLGEFCDVVDLRIHNGNETWGKRKDGKKLLLQSVRW